MKNFKKILAAVLSAAMVVTLAPAGVATNVQAATKATAGTSTLKVSATKVNLKVGKTKTIKVTVNKAQKAALKVSLKSSKAAVAKVASKTTIKKGAKTATFKITAKKAGSAKITVSYKTSANKTVKKTVKVTVSDIETNDDNVDVISSKITLSDAWGLQNGKALKGDLLFGSVPAEIGSIDQVLWYCNGLAVNTTTLNSVEPLRYVDKVGTWYMTVLTTKGTTYKSNEIEVVDTEEAAIIKSFTIEDDYTDGTDLTFASSDVTAVATVTLSKNYAGRINIYKASDSKYTTPIDGITIPKATQANTTANVPADNTGTDNAAVLNGQMPTNYKVENLNAGAGLGFIGEDGLTTYKFVVNGGLDRGTEYVVAFDQDSIATDSPATGKANVFESKVAAPYLTKPASIEVTSASTGANPKATLYGEDKAPLTWISGAAANGAVANTRGFTSVRFYSNTKNEAKGGTALGAADEATTARVKNGVITSGNACGDAAFWYAEVKTQRGIYGDKSETITSAVKDVAQATASSMQILQDSTTPTSAKITFSNLRADGKVYVVATIDSDTANVATEYDTIVNRVRDFSASVPSSYVASADVKKGAAEVLVENAIHPIHQTAGAIYNQYAAIFVPEDSTNYGEVRTATGTFNTNGTRLADSTTNDSLQVTPVVAKFDYSANFAGKTVTGGAVGVADKYIADADAGSTDAFVAKDQFGNDYAGAATSNGANLGLNAVAANSTMPTPTAALNVTLNATGSTTTAGEVSFTFDASSTGAFSVGNKYTHKLVTGQTLTMEKVDINAWKFTLS